MSSFDLGTDYRQVGEQGGVIGEHITKGGTVSVISVRAPTYRVPPELIHEWPSVVSIHRKLVLGGGLDEHGRLWVSELATASGWSEDDIVDELNNLGVNPLERVEKYEMLFRSYYAEAVKRKEEGDIRQAGEKIWGAVTALIKLYAARKGVPVIHWSMSRLDSFVENNVEDRYKRLFRDLIDKAHMLHEHFYEGHLSPEGFTERWKEVIELIERIKRAIPGLVTRHP